MTAAQKPRPKLGCWLTSLQVGILEKRRVLEAVSERTIESDVGKPDQRTGAKCASMAR